MVGEAVRMVGVEAKVVPWVALAIEEARVKTVAWTVVAQLAVRKVGASVVGFLVAEVLEEDMKVVSKAGLQAVVRVGALVATLEVD